MGEKKEVKIATNVSSGAEKVESVEKNVQEENKTPSVKKTVKKQSTQNGAKDKKVKTVSEEKIDVKKTEAKTKKENQAAKARVAAALKKKEAKVKRAAEKKEKAAKRAAEKKALIEKRAAERKAKAEKRAAERKALMEKRKAEREAKIRERAHGKANRSQARSKAKQQRNQKKQERNENRGGKKGYGGWLAAVISLGAVTLGLTTAVTIGAINMKDANDTAMAGYRSTTYELIGIMENVDNDLDRVRVSASPVQQERILTDLLVQSRLAELDLEKMPIPMEADRNLTTFINRVGAESERMLSKLRHGETLSREDEATLERLYQTNHTMRQTLDEYAAMMEDKDIMDYMKKGAGAFKEILDNLENLTLEENRSALDGKMKGAGMERTQKGASEEGSGSPKIDPAKAEEMCSRYFADYDIKEFQCVGETVTRGYMAYNVQGYDDKGTLLFAEVDYNNGELIRFDYYEPCEGETFDMDGAKQIAEAFLKKMGYEDMTAVRVRENGTDVDFNYVYETDGVVYYPDSVKVKVCRARGVVTGMDASKFLRNHQQRSEPETKISLAQAQEKLRSGVEVEASKLAVVKSARGERAAYEFLCSYMGERYFIYTDALTGEEIAIVNVKNIG